MHLPKLARPSARLLAAATVLLLSFAPTALAQVTNGRIELQVVDSSGAGVGGAKISLRDSRRQINVGPEAVTEADGTYLYASLRPSMYEITVEANGFRRAVIANVELLSSATVKLTVKLELGQVTEAISVEANAIQVNTADSQGARSISMREIDVLPQLGRGPLALAALTPGISVDANDQSFSRVNGLRQGSNNTRLDGIDVNDSVVPRFGLTLTPSNTDSVEEVRIITNGGKAEFGRNAGAQIEMVTRSGTNAFHGNAFEFLRNSKLNSNTFFNNAAGTARPKFNQSIFGGSFGGPAIKDKLFFFANFQGTETRQDVSRNRTVATAEAKQGIFRWRDGAGNIQSFNIAANDPAGRGVDPAMRNLFNLMLAPNNNEVGDGLNSAGHRLNIGSPAKSYQGTGKIDWQATALHRVFFRYSKLSAESVDDLNNAERTFPSQQDGMIINDRYGFSVGSDWTLSPTLINEFRAGRQYADTEFARPDRPQGPAIITILFTDPINTTFGQNRKAPVNDFTDNLTILRGKHTFKTGANFRQISQFNQNFNGVYPNVSLARVGGNIVPASFGPQGLSTAMRQQFESLYNDVLGRPGQITQTFYSDLQTFQDTGLPRTRTFDFKELGLFFQDDWKIKPNLTLNIGLRWEYLGSPSETNGLQGSVTRLADINPAANIADFRIERQSQWYKNDYNNFAPRFGFAWDPFRDGKTSIRGGYGIFFDRMIGSASNLSDGNTPGFAQGAQTFPNAAPGANRSFSVLTANEYPQKPAAPVTNPALDRQTSVVAFADNLRTGYVQHFSFGVQREIARNTVLDVNYVRTLGVKLFMWRDLNQPKIEGDFLNAFNELERFRATGAAPSANNTLVRLFGSPTAAVAGVTAAALQQGLAGTAANTIDTVAANFNRYAQAGISNFYLRNFPQFNQFLHGVNDGRSHYNGLQMSLSRNAGGLRAAVNYTFSKALDNTSEEGNGFLAANAPLDNFNLRSNYGRTTADRPHVFNFLASYALPFGRGKRFLTGAPTVVNKLIGDWELGSLGMLQSGRPFTVTSGRRTNASTGNATADYNGTDRSIGAVDKAGNGVFYFTQAQIAQFSFAPAGSIGTAGRNTFRGPGFFNLDFSLVKRIPLTERIKLGYRLEMFNALNRANFNNPNFNFSIPNSFGRITTLVNGSSGNGARVMQMALRLDF
jgi:hypothetical protein